jgi:CelD/BcsL family acetyltransferase involved in cellulose biosynthesis
MRAVGRVALLPLLLGGCLVGALVPTGLPVAGRASLAMSVLVLAPALGFACLAPGHTWYVRLAVAVAGTCVVDSVVAVVMAATGAWYPRVGMVAVAVVSLFVLLAGRIPARVATARVGSGHRTLPPSPGAAGTGGSTRVEVLRPDELSGDELDRWREMQHGSTQQRNPFLSPEFALAVARHRPSARLALVSDAGGVVAVFPFERRAAGVGVPLAAGLTDCQGMVHVPGFECDAKALLRACGLVVWEFDHLGPGQPVFEPYRLRQARSPIMDLSAGYDAYLEEIRRKSPKFVRTARAKARKLTRDVGELEYLHDVRDRAAFDTLTAWKSAQYRRTGRHDRFAHPWITGLVQSLYETRTGSFAGELSMLYAGGEPVAGHFGLRYENTLVGWFPAYDAQYARYSPGIVHHLHMAEGGAAAGLRHIDMGKGVRPYKEWLENGCLNVSEGRVLRASVRGTAYWAGRAVTWSARRVVEENAHLYSAADRTLKGYGRLRQALHREH